jgi:hypothetical protein
MIATSCTLDTRTLRDLAYLAIADAEQPGVDHATREHLYAIAKRLDDEAKKAPFHELGDRP